MKGEMKNWVTFKLRTQGNWGALSIKHPTPDFSLGNEIEPHTQT